MDNFDFQANWETDDKPLSGTRCLVSDGNIVIIAIYVSEHDGDNNWVFSGLDEAGVKSFVVKGWMKLPHYF